MLICVTGPMASGKNYVSSLIEKLSVDGKPFVSIDADIAGHKAVENSRDRILAAFGELAASKNIQLVGEDGNIIRRNLGVLIFGNRELVAKQESIVYPEIISIIESFIEENKDKNVIVNATVLHKIPLVKKMDFIVFVQCPFIVRILRAKKRDGMPLRQILARFRSQRGLCSAYRRTGVRIVRISNFGPEKRLLKKVQNLFTNC